MGFYETKVPQQKPEQLNDKQSTNEMKDKRASNVGGIAKMRSTMNSYFIAHVMAHKRFLRSNKTTIATYMKQ